MNNYYECHMMLRRLIKMNPILEIYVFALLLVIRFSNAAECHGKVVHRVYFISLFKNCVCVA